MVDRNSKPRVIDNPGLNEVYVDKLVGATFNGSALVVTLGAMRLVPETLGQPGEGAQPSVHVSVRVALSPALAIELVNALTNTLKAAEAAAQKSTPKVVSN